MQFYGENQESFSDLKHYRPFCFKDSPSNSVEILTVMSVRPEGLHATAVLC